MTDVGSEGILIKPEDIIIKPLETRLSSLASVTKHLEVRSELFQSRFAAIGKNRHCGWQAISSDGEKPCKQYSEGNEKAIFTGAALCNFSSFAIAEALSRIADGVKVEIVQVYTDFNAERWNDKEYKLNPWGHSIVKVTQSDNDDVRFYDATYGQVDHRKSGKIVCIREDELPRYYRNSSGKVVYDDVTKHKAERLKDAETYSLKMVEYEELIDTLL